MHHSFSSFPEPVHGTSVRADPREIGKFLCLCGDRKEFVTNPLWQSLVQQALHYEEHETAQAFQDLVDHPPGGIDPRRLFFLYPFLHTEQGCVLLLENLRGMTDGSRLYLRSNPDKIWSFLQLIATAAPYRQTEAADFLTALLRDPGVCAAMRAQTRDHGDFLRSMFDIRYAKKLYMQSTAGRQDNWTLLKAALQPEAVILPLTSLPRDPLLHDAYRKARHEVADVIRVLQRNEEYQWDPARPQARGSPHGLSVRLKIRLGAIKKTMREAMITSHRQRKSGRGLLSRLFSGPKDPDVSTDQYHFDLASMGRLIAFIESLQHLPPNTPVREHLVELQEQGRLSVPSRGEWNAAIDMMAKEEREEKAVYPLGMGMLPEEARATFQIVMQKKAKGRLLRMAKKVGSAIGALFGLMPATQASEQKDKHTSGSQIAAHAEWGLGVEQLPDTPETIGTLSQTLTGRDQFLFYALVEEDPRTLLQVRRSDAAASFFQSLEPLPGKGDMVTFSLPARQPEQPLFLPLGAQLKTLPSSGELVSPPDGQPVLRSAGKGPFSYGFELSAHEPELDTSMTIEALQRLCRDRDPQATDLLLHTSFREIFLPDELQAALAEARTKPAVAATEHIRTAVARFLTYDDTCGDAYRSVDEDRRRETLDLHPFLARICEERRGVCRQFSRLCLELLRLAGIPCTQAACLYADGQTITTRDLHTTALAALPAVNGKLTRVPVEATDGARINPETLLRQPGHSPAAELYEDETPQEEETDSSPEQRGGLELHSADQPAEAADTVPSCAWDAVVWAATRAATANDRTADPVEAMEQLLSASTPVLSAPDKEELHYMLWYENVERVLDAYLARHGTQIPSDALATLHRKRTEAMKEKTDYLRRHPGSPWTFIQPPPPSGEKPNSL